MIKVALFIFLVIPLVLLSALLLVLFLTHSTLCAVPETAPRSKPRMDFPQPGLSRVELNRIVGQVQRTDRKRAHFHGSRPVYYSTL